MIIITQYRQEEKNGKIYIRTEESSVCPLCASEIQVIGSRNRKVIGTDGKQQIIVIRRLKCVKCKKIHHELPDLLVPYKRHCTQTIEQTVSGTQDSKEKHTGVFHQTTGQRIKKWWNYVVERFSHLSRSLESKYGVYFYQAAPKEIVRAIANSHSWVQTRSAYMST